MGIGAARLERKEFADAMAVYRQVLALTTSQAKAEAQFRIAEATEAMAALRPAQGGARQSEAAVQQYRLCAEKYPDSEFAGPSLAKLIDYYVEQRDYARAEDLLEQVFQDHPDAAFLDSMLLKWVLVAYQRGDFAKAYDKCSRLIFEYPASEHAKKAKEILPKIEEKVKNPEKAKEKEG
jgi:tetratricopeptide (TPR) repeat protein